MPTAAQALEDFRIAYRAMLICARAVRRALAADVDTGRSTMLPARRIDTADILTIQRVVAEHYGLTVADLVSKRRPNSIAHPRMLAIVLSAELTRQRQITIGQAFNRDHGMVLYSLRQIRAWRDTMPHFDREYAIVHAAAERALATRTTQLSNLAIA